MNNKISVVTLKPFKDVDTLIDYEEVDKGDNDLGFDGQCVLSGELVNFDDGGM